MATYRRNTRDLREVEYIRGLIDADVDSRSRQLAEEGKHAELRELLNTQEKWRGLHVDLTVGDIVKSPATSPAPSDPPFHEVRDTAAPKKSSDKKRNSGGDATDQ